MNVRPIGQAGPPEAQFSQRLFTAYNQVCPAYKICSGRLRSRVAQVCKGLTVVPLLIIELLATTAQILAAVSVICHRS